MGFGHHQNEKKPKALETSCFHVIILLHSCENKIWIVRFINLTSDSVSIFFFLKDGRLIFVATMCYCYLAIILHGPRKTCKLFLYKNIFGKYVYCVLVKESKVSILLMKYCTKKIVPRINN